LHLVAQWLLAARIHGFIPHSGALNVARILLRRNTRLPLPEHRG